MPTTRLAPSPTGALHLGNARTFLINSLLAFQNKWTVVLRIEDLDGPRIKAGADQHAMADLHWLGLQWDTGPIYQSSRTAYYQVAAQRLLDMKLAYPCVCIRREAELASSAPHADDGAGVYPGTCRRKYASVEEAIALTGRRPALRFAVPDRTMEWADQFHPPCHVNLSQLGDFVIMKADGTPAYHLAVVVDDADMNITDIVRGDDLLDSTARHLLLYEALGLSHKIPHWWHLPLVVGTDGRRLAKRHGDTRVDRYRRAGVGRERILALLARWCGIGNVEAVDIPAMVSRFDLAKVPHEPIVFTAADDAWLRGKVT